MEDHRTVLALLGSAPAEATAIAVPDGDDLAYGALREAAAGIASAFAARGVGRGDRVALAEPDGPAFLLALFGALAAGAAVAPLNPAYTEDEFAFYLGDTAPKLLILPDDGLPAARAAAAATGVAIAERSALAPVAGEPPEGPLPDDIALLLHTSGTTSRPKLVPLLHRNLAMSAGTIASFYGLTADDVSYCAMPLFHVHGLVASVLATFRSGGSVVVPRRFTPRALLDQLEPYDVSWVSAGPTTLGMILERDERAGGKATASRLRFLRSCSSALPEKLRHQVEERFGVPLLEAYGMTEASHQIASNPLPPGARPIGSVGIPTGTEIAIADREGRLLDPGAQGEVCIRGAGITPGYLANPEANASSFFDGWFRTGDLGRIDEHGYLYLEGRIKEMVIRGGENISPYEVEGALLAHPAVSEAACFGLADERYGEQVAAAITIAADATSEEILAHCRERLAAFKVPTTLVIVEAIPRTPTGKLQRQRLPGLLGLA